MTETDYREEPLFASAHAALTFAYAYSTEQFAPSVMGRLMGGGAIGSGKGLVGVDGAAEVGFILGEVERLGEPAKWFVAARFAPHHVTCDCRRPCCTGFKPAPAFSAAIFWISENALRFLGDRSVNYRLRRSLVLRYFGERENMSDIAAHAGVHRDTASQHNAKLMPWLKQQEGAAVHAATYALKSAGLVA